MRKVKRQIIGAYLLERFFFDNLENSYQLFLWEGTQKFRHIQNLLFIIVLLVSFLLSIVKVSWLFDLWYFSCDLINAFLDVIEIIFELDLSRLFDMK